MGAPGPVHSRAADGAAQNVGPDFPPDVMAFRAEVIPPGHLSA